MSNYLEFVKVDTTDGRITDVYIVYSTVGKQYLGSIKWYPYWRKYCFFTLNNETVFDATCLNEISKHLDKLMAERKSK